jgi:hypothetical protein
LSSYLFRDRCLAKGLHATAYSEDWGTGDSSVKGTFETSAWSYLRQVIKNQARITGSFEDSNEFATNLAGKKD